MKNLANTNNLIAKVFFYLILILLLLNLAGIIYQFDRTAKFMESHPDGRNNLGIFSVGWMMSEVYLLMMLLVTWGIRQMKEWQWFRLILLILIFCIAIAPGAYFVILVFLKK